MKLGDTDACFEGIHVHLPAFKQVGLWRSVVYCRCVLFPKTSDVLTDLLVKKKVYTDLDETILEVEEILTNINSFYQPK